MRFRFPGIPAASFFSAPPAVRAEENWNRRSVPLTWRLRLLLLWNQLKRYLQLVMPRPEFWLLLFFFFYFVYKIMASFKLLIGEATFCAPPPRGAVAAYGCRSDYEDREGEEGNMNAPLTGCLSSCDPPYSSYPAAESWAGREAMTASQQAVLAAAEKRQQQHLNAERCGVHRRGRLTAATGGAESDSEDDTESISAEDAREMMLVR